MLSHCKVTTPGRINTLSPRLHLPTQMGGLQPWVSGTRQQQCRVITEINHINGVGEAGRTGMNLGALDESLRSEDNF